jgi:hypothetical protein
MEGLIPVLAVWVVILTLNQLELSNRILDLEKQAADLRALLVGRE